MLLGREIEPPPADVHYGAGGRLWIEARVAGRYELALASGKKAAVAIGALPAPIELAGPWELRFPAGWARRRA